MFVGTAPQDPQLGASVRQTRSCEAKPGGSEYGQREPEQRPELLDPSSELQHFLPELGLREFRTIQADHDRPRRAQPTTRRRARDSAIRSDGHIPGALNEMPKAVIVAALQAGRGWHGNDHPPFLTSPNSWGGREASEPR